MALATGLAQGARAHLFLKQGDQLVGVSGWPAGLRLAQGEGLPWAVLEAGFVYLPDLRQDPRSLPLYGDQGGAYLGVALRGPGGLLGVLGLDTAAGGGPLSPEDRAWLEPLALFLGAAWARLRLKVRAQRLIRRHHLLLRLFRRLLLMEDPVAMAREALEVLLKLTPYPAGALYLWKEGQIRLEVVLGAYPPDFPRLYDIHPVRMGEGLLGSPRLWAGEILYVEDYGAWSGALGPYREAGLRSTLIAPLRPKGQPWGALALGSFSHPVPFQEEDRHLLSLIARRLEEALERLLDRKSLVALQEVLLKVLARVLEYRDLETKGHTERVAKLAVRLGEALGFPDLEGLRLGACLHDIGKLALPDEILKKPSALNTREWRLVKTHPEVALDILSPLGFLPETAVNVVLYHHERWDGSGYPFGLKGEEIPLEARIFAVVDVYDALVSQRPYKEAWPRDRALEELRRGAGRTLDPKAVSAFLDLLGREGA